METVVTSDIYLVAALLSEGYEIELPINSNDPRHFKFTIIGDGVDEVKRLWLSGELSGNLANFSRCLKNLKCILHESL